ncbi:ribonuclease inhibitor [Murinocardiopsis flavida]|nr:ribonuclease inhibitor [Murinocardiopsis flavida]
MPDGPESRPGDSEESGPPAADAHGVPAVAPRPRAELDPLLSWLREGRPAARRLDFPAGTALPDGRLDLCKQALGPVGAALVADAMRVRSGGPIAVRHLLLGTDGLGDDGATAVAERTSGTGVQTLYLGCNGITARGAAGIADRLRASPQAVSAVWLKRNPLGSGAGTAVADLVDAAPGLRTLDLVQTGLDPAGLAALVPRVLRAAAAGTPVERLYLGGNPLGAAGAEALADLVAAGAVSELYTSAARLGDSGAETLADALRAMPHGRLARLSVASNGIGPHAAGRLVAAAADAGVNAVDLGRVRAAHVLGAADNRIDEDSAAHMAAALSAPGHRLGHLVLAHTGVTSRAALRLRDGARTAATPTRFLLGKGVARSVRRELDALGSGAPVLDVPAAVAAIRSVHRTAR